jgi:predicted metal-dependent phosphotriesterase family hydrolase
MLTDAVPALLQAGFTQADVHTFLTENTRKFFARSGQPI